ncbi:MAG: electron transfer flavoprotein subunit beta/FixA family protein [Peptococcaceae bacterium]|nr:electron transfer flavoprotein subunit beta/FixA family protein [Peptococcaceae bacterium]
MRIVVCMKQTFDTEAKIALTADGLIDSTGVTLVVDPYSEFAVEKGIQFKEKFGGEVVIVCIGDTQAETAIRQCMAMGADRAVIVTDPAMDGSDQSATARVLAKAVISQEPDIILGGFKSVDSGSAQVMLRLAEILNLPHVNVVTNIEIGEGKAIATRELDDGVELVEVSLPAIFTAQQGLAEPRYPSVKGIMQAKKKELKRLTLADLDIDPTSVGPANAKVKIHGLTLPAPRKGGRIIGGEIPEATADLVKALRDEAKVI